MFSSLLVVLTGVPIAYSMALEMGAILGITIAVIVSAAIPLTTGMAKGHVTLGIIGAFITLPAAAMLGCIGGMPVACVFALLISIIPAPNKPLLTQAEIEAEMRKFRGF